MLDKTTGDMYINGIVDGFSLSHTSKGFFIMKISKDYELKFYSAFDFGKVPMGGTLILNKVSQADPLITSVFGYKSDFVEAYRWGLVTLNALTGLV